ncbi:hypothetical protein OCU04_005431 [Sclerotinia nivalis]|uniref:Uncharacterized protein n=1 Tax=Sclerotinia nivalis TaxID=352851 RepID=A0A9X0DL65_9HELO|nr:hypothetical protein OCU04_005431 [Sclerotinia nivalis]
MIESQGLQGRRKKEEFIDWEKQVLLSEGIESECWTWNLWNLGFIGEKLGVNEREGRRKEKEGARCYGVVEPAVKIIDAEYELLKRKISNPSSTIFFKSQT